MKKFLLIVLLAVACESGIEKPQNLIPEDKMTDILYDAAVLDAIRTQRPFLLTQQQINPTQYLYKKHGIDSTQFVQSNRYYAQDIEKYKAMYQKVSKRLEEERKKLDKPGEKQLVPDTPRIE